MEHKPNKHITNICTKQKHNRCQRKNYHFHQTIYLDIPQKQQIIVKDEFLHTGVKNKQVNYSSLGCIKSNIFLSKKN